MNTATEKINKYIKDQYQQSLEAPKTKSQTQYLLCPIGLVGAGKTTVVKPLSEKLGLVRISSDEIRKLLKENGQSYDSVHEIAFDLINEFASVGYSICIDSDCLSKVDKIKEVAKRHNFKIIWIHINPSEEFIVNKLSNLKPNWLGTAEEMVANYYERKPLHKNINLDFTFVFDTSRSDLKKQIAESVKVIEKAVQA